MAPVSLLDQEPLLPPRTVQVYLYWAIDQYGQGIDVLVSEKRELASTRRFFTPALEHGPCPSEVSTDRAPAYPRVLDELVPSACHVLEQYANNPIEADHARFKARLRPMLLTSPPDVFRPAEPDLRCGSEHVLPGEVSGAPCERHRLCPPGGRVRSWTTSHTFGARL